ncbi:Hypothetical protein AT6N2_L1968 [Agrobacterium tumefaciens]|nr:Hypothetical protein AT6N2_L1968 [Agrobacterium tumefaciens]
MGGRQHITQHHVAGVPRQGLLAIIGKQAVAKDKREGGGVGNVEKRQSADLPMQLQWIDALPEYTALLAPHENAFQRIDGRAVELTDRFRRLHVPAVMDILDHHHADESRITPVVIEGEPTELVECRHGLQIVQLQIAFTTTNLGIGLLQHMLVKALLVGEVIIDHALGRARARGDLVDPRSRQTVLRKFLHRHGQNIAPHTLRVPFRRAGLCCAFGSRGFRHGRSIHPWACGSRPRPYY